MEDLPDKHIFERCCPKQSLKYKFELMVLLEQLEWLGKLEQLELKELMKKDKDLL